AGGGQHHQAGGLCAPRRDRDHEARRRDRRVRARAIPRRGCPAGALRRAARVGCARRRATRRAASRGSGVSVRRWRTGATSHVRLGRSVGRRWSGGRSLRQRSRSGAVPARMIALLVGVARGALERAAPRLVARYHLGPEGYLRFLLAAQSITELFRRQRLFDAVLLADLALLARLRAHSEVAKAARNELAAVRDEVAS